MAESGELLEELAAEDPAAKRLRPGEESNEVAIPQQFVGWLKGKGGSQIRDIEARSAAHVSIDQGTKELGYSKVVIRGGSAEVQAATDIINNELKRVMDRDKYSSEAAPGAAVGGELEECQIPQKYVGWLKGAGGAQISDMEAKTGASVRIDQTSRDLGYSVAQISGTGEAVQACRALIEGEIARVQERDRIIAEHSGGRPASVGRPALSGEPNEVRIPQQYVGWIKGSGGAQIKDIEVRTAAHVTIDQSTKELGYSRALLYGSDEAVRAARQIIESELARVMDRDKTAGAAPVASATPAPDALSIVASLLTAAATNNTQQLAAALSGLVTAAAAANANAAAAAKVPTRLKPAAEPGDTGEWDGVRIPNSCVGWLKGRQGGMIREIENRSGCQIDIDQSTKDQGYSIASVHGAMEQKKLAHGLVIAEVAKVLDQSGEPSDPSFLGCKAEFRIDTQYVGWVKGPKGKVVQDIQTKTATRIDVDQNTREFGFAVVKIFGTLEGTQRARVLVASELSKISPEASAEIVREVPGGLEALQQAISQAKGISQPFQLTSLGACGLQPSYGLQQQHHQQHQQQVVFAQQQPLYALQPAPAPVQVQQLSAYGGQGAVAYSAALQQLQNAYGVATACQPQLYASAPAFDGGGLGAYGQVAAAVQAPAPAPALPASATQPALALLQSLQQLATAVAQATRGGQLG